MKKVIIVHGYGETENSFWYPYLKRELENKGYEVNIPNLPNTNNPKLIEQRDFLLENFEFDEDTILIGHSSGGPVILAILEKLNIKISKVIIVAGYITKLKTLSDDTKNLKDEFDWSKIKNNCQKFIFINADNDPWGADDKQGKMMQEKLGGKLIVNHEGHMGSETFNQPYKEIPFLLELFS
jgi:uncharacterized protein